MIDNEALFSIFKEINDVDGVSKKKKRSKKKSVTSVFHSGIKRLMKCLIATEPFFVRCINRNKERSSTVWTESIVKHQLRCGGLLEALRVLKLGYTMRLHPLRLHRSQSMCLYAEGLTQCFVFCVRIQRAQTGSNQLFVCLLRAASTEQTLHGRFCAHRRSGGPRVVTVGRDSS